MKRMNYTWRRAAKAMLVTSSTTAFAFLATGFSKLMPIRAFGFYAAILIPMNFIMVITVYPSLIIIHEKTFKKIKFNCCRKKKCQLEDFDSKDL